jgi:hypothetical protein
LTSAPSHLPARTTSVPFDRHFWLAVLLAAAVFIPRTTLVARAHSEYCDDQFHLSSGLSFLRRVPPHMHRNDPPLGQGLLALPLYVLGVAPDPPAVYRAKHAHDPGPHVAQGSEPFFAPAFEQSIPAERLLLIVAIWKSILFVPGAALVFHWCRRLYGLRAAWLALAVLLVEPTVAGHIAPASLDLLAVEAILFACFLTWRYLESPSLPRVLAAGVATAAALLIKHTAVILPAVIVCYAFVARVLGRDRGAPIGPALRQMTNNVAAVGLVAVVALWPLTLFDVSKPSTHGPIARAVYTESYAFRTDILNPALERPWPAGIYVGSIATAANHTSFGHDAYLFGQHRMTGWRWYYAAVAAYKVPIGLALILFLGLVSLARVRPRPGELALLIPALAWTAFISLQPINIGFRHFLPAYVPMLMLACRWVADTPSSVTRSRVLSAVAWLAVIATAIEVHTWHPDYLSYVNRPREGVQYAISDSNLDWGQSLKEVRDWLETHPHPGQRVYVAYFGSPEGWSVRHYLGDRATELPRHGPGDLPRRGLLVISPVALVGDYDPADRYRALREADQAGRTKPLAIIGHTMRVYDLATLPRAAE